MWTNGTSASKNCAMSCQGKSLLSVANGGKGRTIPRLANGIILARLSLFTSFGTFSVESTRGRIILKLIRSIHIREYSNPISPSSRIAPLGVNGSFLSQSFSFSLSSVLLEVYLFSSYLLRTFFAKHLF